MKSIAARPTIVPTTMARARKAITTSVGSPSGEKDTSEPIADQPTKASQPRTMTTTIAASAPAAVARVIRRPRPQPADARIRAGEQADHGRHDGKRAE